MTRGSRVVLAMVLWSILILSTAAPVAAGDDPQADAIAAAESWLTLTDAGNYAEAWEEAASFLKNVVTKEQFAQQLGAVRGPLGGVQSRKVKASQYTTSLPGAPDGRYVVIQFETSFENKGSALETVTPMFDTDGKWRVSGYYIR